MDFIQTLYDERYYCTVHFDVSLNDLDLDSRSQECEKAEKYVPIICLSLQLIWVECGVLLKLVGAMNLVLIVSCPFSIQGR